MLRQSALARALEINKRYHLNEEGRALAAGKESKVSLLDFAISADAVWACTACGACVEVCPVNNEPMRDILDIRRNLVLMENTFPAQWQQAFKGMERLGNPWNVAPESRLDWAQGLDVPTIEQNPSPDILWWVGCAPATDPRAQKTPEILPRSSKRPASILPSWASGNAARAIRPAVPETKRFSSSWPRATSRFSTRSSQADRHDLPALPAHAQKRIPGLRREL